MITIWLISATIGCLIIAHVLTWMKKTREHLGKQLKKILSNHYKSIVIIDKRKSSILKFKDEKIFFFLIERVVFPVMLVAVLIVTGFDIYLYRKYHSSYYDKTFLYLFPIPYVAPSMFAVNFVMSVVTATKIFYCDEPNEHSAKLKKFLTFVSLILPFGSIYLFYHGFWTAIALLVYPERILIGGIFVVPLMFVTIPIWNTIIKIAENWFGVCNESSSCCICCCTYKCNCCIHCHLCRFFSRISCCKNICEVSKNKCKWKPRCDGCVWLAILVYEIVFWGLLIVILFYTSRVLIDYDDINLQNKMFHLVLYYTVASGSGILAWLNTELVIHPQKRTPAGQ